MHPSVKKALRILNYFLLSLGVVVLLLVVVINLPFAHVLLTKKANQLLKDNGIPASVGAISLSITGEIELKKIEFITAHHDTIIYADKLAVSFKVLPLFSKQLHVENIFIESTAVRLIADSSGKLNLLSFFPDSPQKGVKEKKSGNSWEIQVGEVHLLNIDFLYRDSINGILIDQYVHKADLSFDSFSILNRQIDIAALKIEKATGMASVSTIKDTIETVTITPRWKFSARNIELLDFHYTYQNPISRQSAVATLKKANIAVKKLDLSTRELIVSLLNLSEPRVTYTASKANTPVASANETAKTQPSETPWSILCNILSINNGYFDLDQNDSLITESGRQWLPVTKLNTTIKDFQLTSQKAGCDLNQLSFLMNDKLFLQSGKISVQADSSLNGKVALDLVASLNPQQKLSSTQLDTIRISAVLSGSMNLLTIEKFNFIGFSGAELNVSGFITDVTKIPDSKCNLLFHTNTISRNQTLNLISLFASEINLPNFRPFDISGAIKNTLFQPDFNVTINSGSGKIDAKGNYDLKNHNSKLDVMLTEIKLNEILGEQYPENLTAKVFWTGRLGGLNDLAGTGSLDVDELVYEDLVSKDLLLNFKVDSNICRFTALAEDSTLSCDLNGIIDWDKLSYRGQLAGNFSFNETASNLLPGNCNLSSGLTASFLYSPENIESSLDLFKIALGKDGNNVAIDSLSWDLKMTESSMRSGLVSDFMSADFNCQSGISDFADAIKKIGFEKMLKLDSTNFINSAGFSALPVFDLTVSAEYDSIFNIFLPDTVFSFNDVNLKAGKSEINQQVKLDLSVDSISYGNMQCFGTKVVMIADDKILNGTLTLDSTNINGVWGGPTAFNIDILPDKINASVLVADSIGLPVYQLGMEALKGKDKVTFRSGEPDWIINSGKWSISNPEFLILEIPSKDFIASLNLTHEQMLIDLSGRNSDSLKLILKNVLISQLISPKVVTLAPDGILDATIIYNDNDGKYANFDLNVKDLTWKGVVLEKIEADGYFNIDASGNMKSELTALLNDSSGLKLKIIPGDSISGNNISAVFDQLPVKLLEPFTKEYINKMDGFASGELSISGENKKPVFDGNIRLRAITLNIVPLQAWFTIPDDSIVIKSSLIYFDRFMILDSLQKQLYVNGTLDIETGDKVIADLQVSLDDIRVMNTTIKDNPEFFGSIIVNSGLKITGLVTQPAIKGNITLQNGTNITYRQKNDITVQEAQQTVTFASLSGDSTETIIPISRIREISGMPAIQTTIDINPKSKFNIEISSGYDIHIGVSGSGLLNYTMLPNNSMSLTGSYEINQGTADLKFTVWPLKNFLITPGSSLRWDGDIADPTINLEATSKVEGSYVNPVDGKTRYVDFIVSMKLSDQLSKLDIVFSVKSPDQYITSVLNALPEDEQMRQAINLLIFESINLPNIESSSNYLDSQINSFWESQLNSITKTSFKNIDLSFGVDSYTQTSSGGAEEEKTSLTYEMEKKFFHERASVKISGRFNDDPQAGEQTNTMVENFIFEYELDSLERNLLKLYTRKDYEDILDGEVTKSGVGYIYRKSYPDFRSIWKRKKGTTRATEQATPKIK